MRPEGPLEHECARFIFTLFLVQVEICVDH